MRAGRYFWGTALTLIGVLSIFLPANAFTVFQTPGAYNPIPTYKHGAVYTRAVVYENGYRVWVGYGENGEILSDLHVQASDEYADAWVLAANGVRSRLVARPSLMVPSPHGTPPSH